MHMIKQLQQYLYELSNRYSATICIKDFSGFLYQDKNLLHTLSPFINHTSPYCMYVKGNKKCMRDCLDMIPKMLNKCRETHQSFSGFCHAGMYEYVIPIIQKDNILGAITFGCYASNSTPEYKNFHSLAQKHPDLNASLLSQLYQKEPKTPAKEDMATILLSLEFIASYLASFDNRYSTTEDTAKLVSQSKDKEEDLFIQHALTYIKMHLTENIRIEDIAQYCNYSTSYVSRNFNKTVGMNISTYINKLRIEISKSYLITSDKTIAEIAEIVGFEDLSYYSRVFSSLLGIPPTEFRRRFS